MTHDQSDIITPEQAKSIGGLFQQRVQRTPDSIAYRYFDNTTKSWLQISWSDMAQQVAQWQAAMARESLQPGDRVAVMLNNCCQWVMFDQAALGLGLVVVPLYVNDRSDNISYILNQTNTQLLLIEGREHWQLLLPVIDQLTDMKRIVSIDKLSTEITDQRMSSIDVWLKSELNSDNGELQVRDIEPNSLATIVYTSGTTGRPKGVMLSHHNILWNAFSAQQCIEINSSDQFLSFLPLSHTLERSIGYYLPMMTGATVAYARSITQLADDLLTIHPTVFISVPRIYERVHGRILEQLEEKSPFSRTLFNQAINIGWARFEYQQGRRSWCPTFLLWPFLKRLVADKVMEKLGGRIRIAITGGAPLSPEIAKLFIGLGMPLLQGYGLTETSPVISVNRPKKNYPASVGSPLNDVEIMVNQQGELLSRSPGVMLGYWNNQEATAEMIDADGWLHTGDKVRIEDNQIYITGRLKEIIVMSNGEKVPPADMEMAIAMDPLIDQVMVVGEGRSFLVALVVLNPDQWPKFASQFNLDFDGLASLNEKRIKKAVRKIISAHLHNFPGYAQIRKVFLTLESWSIENGLQTPTLKLRRAKILECFNNEVKNLYQGH